MYTHQGLGLEVALMLLLVASHLVQSLQAVPHTRSKFPRRGGLFPSRTSLFEKQQQQQQDQELTNGSEILKKISHDDIATQPLRKRDRVRNLWSAIFQISPETMARAGHSEGSSLHTPLAPAGLVDELETENKLLRETIRQLEHENERLSSQQKVVLETFEGEGRLRPPANDMLVDRTTGADAPTHDYGVTLSADELTGDIPVTQDGIDGALWCDDLDEDSCPVEPSVSFGSALRDRAYWLVGLLIMQSCSGIILSRNEALLANHPVIIYFLTMLVGAGGNAGNQASVRVIRGIALGSLNEKTQGQFLTREFKMAGALSVILSVAGFLRAAAFRTPLLETIAVTSSLALIVFTSICLGAILPLLLQKMGVDPAHSSTSIQVVMDILGVFVAVAVSGVILDGPLGALLISKLGG